MQHIKKQISLKYKKWDLESDLEKDKDAKNK